MGRVGDPKAQEACGEHLVSTDLKAVLAAPMPQPNGAGAATIGDYMVKLLEALWREQDCFDGKRPFGSSDWTAEIVIALINAGLISGEVDEDGYLEHYDTQAADQLIASAIRSLAPAVAN